MVSLGCVGLVDLLEAFGLDVGCEWLFVVVEDEAGLGRCAFWRGLKDDGVSGGATCGEASQSSLRKSGKRWSPAQHQSWQTLRDGLGRP